MCPDPQLLSIYVDGELPSPWKEKMEAHLKTCPSCRQKHENFWSLHELFKKDNTVRRTYIERVVDESEQERTYTEDDFRLSKEKVWNNIKEKRQLRSKVWRRRLSIPIPAAAAAAVVIAVVTVLWIRGETIFQQHGVASRQDTDRVDFILAAEETDEIPVLPTADINGVLQYLASDGTDIIILRLPESASFSRTGDPAIIRAADFTRPVDQTGRRP